MIPGDGPVPAAVAHRRERIAVRNTGRFPAYLSSHFPLAWASRALELPRDRLEGARLGLPAGASVCIAPGETVEVEAIWT